jgi:hypothetical protein
MQFPSVYAGRPFIQTAPSAKPLYGSAIGTFSRGARRLPPVKQRELRLPPSQAEPAIGEQPGRLRNLSSQAFTGKLPIMEALIFWLFLTVTLVSMIDGYTELSRLIRTDSVGRVAGQLLDPTKAASNNTEVSP